MKTVTNYTVPALGFPHIERALIAGYRFSETPPDWSPEAIAKYKEEKRQIANCQEAVPFLMSLDDRAANVAILKSPHWLYLFHSSDRSMRKRAEEKLCIVLRRSLKSLMELPKEHADLLVATMTEVLDTNRPEKDLKVPSAVVNKLIQALGSE